MGNIYKIRATCHRMKLICKANLLPSPFLSILINSVTRRKSSAIGYVQLSVDEWGNLKGSPQWRVTFDSDQSTIGICKLDEDSVKIV